MAFSRMLQMRDDRSRVVNMLPKIEQTANISDADDVHRHSTREEIEEYTSLE